MGFGTNSFFVRPKRKMFPVDFVAKKMEMVICFGSVLFHLYCMLGSSLNLLTLCLWIVEDGLVAHSGMAGCLVLVVLVLETLWAASFGQLACELERRLGAYPVDDSGHWTPPDYWDADDLVGDDGCAEYLDGW